MARSIISLLLLFYCVTFALGQNKIEQLDWTEYFNKIHVADTSYGKKEYSKAARQYSEAFAFNMQSFSAGHKFQAACAWSMAGKSDSAISNLEQEVTSGFSDLHKLMTEKALQSLHANPGWTLIKVHVNENKIKEDRKLGRYKSVKPRLEKIFDLDQLYRAEYMSTWKTFGFESAEMKSLQVKMKNQDDQNLKYVSNLIDKYGWIGYDTVGFKANQALFLVIQHADSSIQEKYLPNLELAVKKNKALGQHLALLKDRILIRRGSKQLFGSQIQCDTTGQKCWILPIEDEINVDKKRAEFGLEPLADYARQFGIIYKKSN